MSPTTEDLIDRLARIDVKLDQLLARDDDHEARIRKLEQRDDPAREDHETRIRKLERAVWLVAGAAAAGGGVVGSLIAPLLGA